MQEKAEQLDLANAVVDADIAAMHHRPTHLHSPSSHSQGSSSPVDTHGSAGTAAAAAPAHHALHAQHLQPTTDAPEATGQAAATSPTGLAEDVEHSTAPMDEDPAGGPAHTSADAAQIAAHVKLEPGGTDETQEGGAPGTVAPWGPSSAAGGRPKPSSKAGAHQGSLAAAMFGHLDACKAFLAAVAVASSEVRITANGLLFIMQVV